MVGKTCSLWKVDMGDKYLAPAKVTEKMEHIPGILNVMEKNQDRIESINCKFSEAWENVKLKIENQGLKVKANF